MRAIFFTSIRRYEKTLRSSKFITFEGGEGSGKSTQIRLLGDYLSERGLDCVTTREPGGTEGADAIRKILVTGQNRKWEPVSEALLHCAARHSHLTTTVWPALQRGTWVISDRFADSTMAYQGIAMGLGEDSINWLYEFTVGNFSPDLTLILDLPVELGLARAQHRGSDENRYEKMNIQFHEQVRKAFLEIAKSNPSRCIVVDAHGTVDEVRQKIISAVTERFDV